jgi:hypothetical protein
MGTSIALAFRKMVTRGAGKLQLALKVVKRTCILFLFGIMISNSGSNGKKIIIIVNIDNRTTQTKTNSGNKLGQSQLQTRMNLFTKSDKYLFVFMI